MKELTKLIENSKFFHKKEEGKLNVLIVEPGLSVNEYYTLIQPKYYFSGSDKINYQIARIGPFHYSPDIDIKIFDLSFADVLILPSSLQNFDNDFKEIKKLHPKVKIGMQLDYLPSLLTKTLMHTNLIQDKKFELTDELFSRVKQQLHLNICSTDFLLVHNESIQKMVEREYDKKCLLIPSLLIEDIFNDYDQIEFPYRDSFVDNILSVLIDYELEQEKNIYQFISKVAKLNKKIIVNIIGGNNIKLEEKHDFVNTYPHQSIITRQQLIAKINPDVYIDLRPSSKHNIHFNNDIVYKEIAAQNIIPFIPLKLTTKEYPYSYSSIPNLILKLEKIMENTQEYEMNWNKYNKENNVYASSEQIDVFEKAAEKFFELNLFHIFDEK